MVSDTPSLFLGAWACQLSSVDRRAMPAVAARWLRPRGVATVQAQTPAAAAGETREGAELLGSGGGAVAAAVVAA